MSTQPTTELFRATASRVLVANMAWSSDTFVSSLSEIIVLRVGAHDATKIYLMITEQGSNRCCLLDAWEYYAYPGWHTDNALVSWDWTHDRPRLFIIFQLAQAAEDFRCALETTILGWLLDQDNDTLERLINDLDEPADLY